MKLDENTFPFNRVVKVIIDLIKFSKGGISPEEGAILAEELLEILMHLKVR
jgi:hypothetical protein